MKAILANLQENYTQGAMVRCAAVCEKQTHCEMWQCGWIVARCGDKHAAWADYSANIPQWRGARVTLSLSLSR